MSEQQTLPNVPQGETGQETGPRARTRAAVSAPLVPTLQATSSSCGPFGDHGCSGAWTLTAAAFPGACAADTPLADDDTPGAKH
jgi:hypothetical protein